MITAAEQEEHFRDAFNELLSDYNAVQITPINVKIRPTFNEESGLLLADCAQFTIESEREDPEPFDDEKFTSFY
tara:strand:- start:1325 stop:1546 length:222 start_codon:yes stop_codon:yes gene_type:complete